MGMIDRYRKKGGFVQLLALIETTGNPKQEKFLKMIGDESPAWEAQVKKKMLSMERIANWPVQTLMEFMPKIPAMAVAMAVHPLSKEKKATVLSALSHFEKKKVEDYTADGKVPSSGEIAASQIRIINEIRNLSNNGQLKFDKFDPELTIPENIEDQLASGNSMVTDKDVSQHFEAIPTGAPANLSDELTHLRKKVVHLMQENTRLNQQNTEMKEKLDAIKKIA